ncbi:unnamed protein product [Linum trigynum]|uniref:Uncharacterized protein n=1 Tax=Linum trigynum TaxID=586398 RepID=A0AAV2DBX8_9ROSI
METVEEAIHEYFEEKEELITKSFRDDVEQTCPLGVYHTLPFPSMSFKDAHEKGKKKRSRGWRLNSPQVQEY